jgi:hypothetical protein
VEIYFVFVGLSLCSLLTVQWQADVLCNCLCCVATRAGVSLLHLVLGGCWGVLTPASSPLCTHRYV